MADLMEPIDFLCPRCGAGVAERVYGPCRGCRQQLCDAVSGEGRAVVVERFEPTMHVTPNAVALKDD